MNNDTTENVLIDWLRDAYAMERGLEVTLNRQKDNEELSPQTRAQSAKHLAETERHAAAVKRCLESLGADTSAVKTGMAEVMEAVKGFGAKFASDEPVKLALASFAAEQFEIACYRALRTAALDTGHPDIAEVCEEIIGDEERMAEWLEDNLPETVTAYLQDAAAVA